MHTARTSLSQAQRPATFVELVRQNDGSFVHRIATYDEKERPCWFLLKANALGLAKLEHTAYEDMIDLTRFGEIVGSGWGHLSGDSCAG